MTLWYVLGGEDGHTPIPVEDFLKAAKQFEKTDRHVAQTKKGDVLVSTIFLAIDHNFRGTGPPILFETMIFGGEHDDYQTRCSTWKEAEDMHKKACRLAFGPALRIVGEK